MDPKRALVHYFTGTGNTGYAVQRVADELARAGYAVTQHRVERKGAPLAGAFDLHLFAFPVYGFSAPALFLQYVQELPAPPAGTAAAILSINGATMAGGNVMPGCSGGSMETVARALQGKGYDVFLTAAVSYPANWTQMMNPAGAADQQLIFAQAAAGVSAFAAKLLRHQSGRGGPGRMSSLVAGVVAFLFRFYGRRVLGKLYVADRRCTACGLCVRNCPAGTIQMGGARPVWRGNCQACNRCINLCPTQAIQTSVVRLLVHGPVLALAEVVLAVLVVVYGWPLTSGWSPVARAAAAVAAIGALLVVVSWLQLTLLEGALGWLERRPWLRPLFEMSFTRRFRRYLAPGFGSLPDDGHLNEPDGP